MRAIGLHLITTIGLFLLNFVVHASSVSPIDSLPQHCYFLSKFDQEKNLKSLPVPLKSSGRMYFSCKAGLIWQTQTPIQESLILTRSEYHFKQQGSSNIKSRSELEVLDSVEIRFLSRLLIGLMSADKAYINKNFTITETTKHAFELRPKDNFISKAIKTVNIQKSDDENSLNIIIDQKDGTLISIRSHSAIILDKAEDSTACLQNNFEETHCQALFEPLRVATQLNDNAGS